MDSFSYFFAQKLKAAIDAEVQDLAQTMLSGHAAERYMRLVGKHDAYQRVVELMDEIHRELTSPDPTKNRST
jgi:DNA-binding FrmR family transcriptional regulator